MKALASLHVCTKSSELSLFENVISTELPCVGLYDVTMIHMHIIKYVKRPCIAYKCSYM